MFDKRISFFVALVIGMVAWKSEIFFSSRTQQTHSSSEPDATTSSRKKPSLLALLNAQFSHEEMKHAWLEHRVRNVHSNEVTEKANVGQSLPSPPLRSPPLGEIHAHHLTNTRRHDLVTLPKDIPAVWANVTSTSSPSMSISASLFQQPQGSTAADESDGDSELEAPAPAPAPPPPCGVIGDRCESSYHGVESPCCDQYNTESRPDGTVECHKKTGGDGNRCQPRVTPIPTRGLCSPWTPPPERKDDSLWYPQFAACAQDAEHCRRCHDSEKKLHRCLPKAQSGKKCWLLAINKMEKRFADMGDCEATFSETRLLNNVIRYSLKDGYVCQPPTGSFATGYFVEGICAETTNSYRSVVMYIGTLWEAKRAAWNT